MAGAWRFGFVHEVGYDMGGLLAGSSICCDQGAWTFQLFFFSILLTSLLHGMLTEFNLHDRGVQQPLKKPPYYSETNSLDVIVLKARTQRCLVT